MRKKNHNLNTASKTTQHPSSLGRRMEHRKPTKASKQQQKCTTSTTKTQNIYDHDGYHNLQTPTLPKLSVKSKQVQVATSCLLYKAQQHFSKEWLDTLDPPRVNIDAYRGQPICSLGSCVVYLHIDNKVFPTIFEVTDIPGPIILGRKQVKAMDYVQCPAIKHPKILSMSSPLHKVLQVQHTIPNLKQTLKINMLKWTSKTNVVQHITSNLKWTLKVQMLKRTSKTNMIQHTTPKLRH